MNSPFHMNLQMTNIVQRNFWTAPSSCPNEQEKWLNKTRTNHFVNTSRILKKLFHSFRLSSHSCENKNVKIPPIFKGDLIKKLSRLTKKTFCPRPKFSFSNTRHKGEKSMVFHKQSRHFFSSKEGDFFYSIYAILFSHPNSFTQHFFLLMFFFVALEKF